MFHPHASPGYVYYGPQFTDGGPEAWSESIIHPRSPVSEDAELALEPSRVAWGASCGVRDGCPPGCAVHDLHNWTKGTQPGWLQNGALKTALEGHRATMSKGDQSHLPFCQVMAGRGAPEVSQASTTDMPSITVLSKGPLVMLGAMPAEGDRSLLATPWRRSHSQRNRSSSCPCHSGCCGSPHRQGCGCPDGAPALGKSPEGP